jgi:hypothetical protein
MAAFFEAQASLPGQTQGEADFEPDTGSIVKRKETGHYSGLFKHTVKFLRTRTANNRKSLARPIFSACHHCW